MRLWYVLFLHFFFLPVPDLVPDLVPRGNKKGQSKGGRVAKCLEKGYRRQSCQCLAKFWYVSGMCLISSKYILDTF